MSECELYYETFKNVFLPKTTPTVLECLAYILEDDSILEEHDSSLNRVCVPLSNNPVRTVKAILFNLHSSLYADHKSTHCATAYMLRLCDWETVNYGRYHSIVLIIIISTIDILHSMDASLFGSDNHDVRFILSTLHTISNKYHEATGMLEEYNMGLNPLSVFLCDGMFPKRTRTLSDTFYGYILPAIPFSMIFNVVDHRVSVNRRMHTEPFFIDDYSNASPLFLLIKDVTQHALSMVSLEEAVVYMHQRIDSIVDQIPSIDALARVTSYKRDGVGSITLHTIVHDAMNAISPHELSCMPNGAYANPIRQTVFQVFLRRLFTAPGFKHCLYDIAERESDIITFDERTHAPQWDTATVSQVLQTWDVDELTSSYLLPCFMEIITRPSTPAP